MRLIDADDLTMQMIANFQQAMWGGADSDECQLALDTIGEAPIVDAVEVVRCKDCIHDNMTTCPLCWIENHTMHFINHNSDDFCSCGESRSNG